MIKRANLMKNSVTTNLLQVAVSVAVCLWCGNATAQQHPERRHIRSGNRGYEGQDYTGSEQKYRVALEKNPTSYEASFNLADALYKQERYEEAVGVLNELSQSQQLTSQQLAKVYHNLGNVLFQQEKLQEAIDSYKMSLRQNPADLETKYNLAYAQKLLQEQQNDDQNQDQNKDQQSDGENDQENKENQYKEDKGDQNQDQKGQPDQQDKQQDQPEGEDDKQGDKGDQEKPQPDKPQPQQGQSEGNMRREDAQNILDAMQQQEDKTREKVNEQRAVTVGRSGKNW